MKLPLLLYFVNESAYGDGVAFVSRRRNKNDPSLNKKGWLL